MKEDEKIERKKKMKITKYNWEEKRENEKFR